MKLVYSLFGAAALLAAIQLHAQSDPAAPSETTNTVELPEFTVHSEKDTSYVGKQALSTARTGTELLDLSQSVKVLNRAFIDDVNPSLLVDTLKYVGGAQAGNINFSVDRYMLRGFTGEGDYVDGFRTATDNNTDLSLVERLEIIKGPSAIFIANGPVGGVINKISKSPTDYVVRSLKVQVGLWDANRVELDLGGPITADKKLQFRFVAAGQDADGWYDHTYVHRIVIGPSLAYQFSPTTRLTLKYNYVENRFSSYNGIPFDLRTGAVAAVPPKTTYNEDAPLNWRKDLIHRVTLEFTSRLNDVLAVRFATFASRTESSRVESVNGGAIPATYVPGALINRSTTAQDNYQPRRQIQNDYVFTFPTGPVSNRLLVGLDYMDFPTTNTSYAGTSSPINPLTPVFPGTVTVGTTPSSKLTTDSQQFKGYILETAGFFHDRLQLSYGSSRIRALTSSTNHIASTATPELSLNQDLKQYGAVFKATDHVSIFYGYNENFAPNFLNGLVLPSQIGKQKEGGVKAELLEGRLSVSAAYFDIVQANIAVPTFPQTSPPTFLLVPGQASKGFDGDVYFSVTKNFDLIVAFANMDAVAHTQANSTAPVVTLPINNVSEQTWSTWGRYKWADGSLKGLSLAVGVNYQSRRAITDSGNATLFGWAAGRTLVDAVVGYDTTHFKYALNIDNLFNTRYIQAVRNQSIIIPGTDTNVKGSVTWKF